MGDKKATSNSSGPVWRLRVIPRGWQNSHFNRLRNRGLGASASHAEVRYSHEHPRFGEDREERKAEGRRESEKKEERRGQGERCLPSPRADAETSEAQRCIPSGQKKILSSNNRMKWNRNFFTCVSAQIFLFLPRSAISRKKVREESRAASPVKPFNFKSNLFIPRETN